MVWQSVAGRLYILLFICSLLLSLSHSFFHSLSPHSLAQRQLHNSIPRHWNFTVVAVSSYFSTDIFSVPSFFVSLPGLLFWLSYSHSSAGHFLSCLKLDGMFFVLCVCAYAFFYCYRCHCHYLKCENCVQFDCKMLVNRLSQTTVCVWCVRVHLYVRTNVCIHMLLDASLILLIFLSLFAFFLPFSRLLVWYSIFIFTTLEPQYTREFNFTYSQCKQLLLVVLLLLLLMLFLLKSASVKR